jgi:hypothetical protein
LWRLRLRMMGIFAEEGKSLWSGMVTIAKVWSVACNLCFLFYFSEALVVMDCVLNGSRRFQRRGFFHEAIAGAVYM